MASVRRSIPTTQAHPLFRGVFDAWLTKADALSALPNAPVVPDTPNSPNSRNSRNSRNSPNASRQLQLPIWQRLRSRFGRYAVTEVQVR
ncbi:hypothetical protein ACWD26_17910 [Streptomyces sp. NPDC002787]